jgi:hypothetical protein
MGLRPPHPAENIEAPPRTLGLTMKFEGEELLKQYIGSPLLVWLFQKIPSNFFT